MKIHFRLSGIIDAPDGSEIQGERSIRLPQGDLIYLWSTVVLNGERDIDFKEMQSMGIELTDCVAHLDID